MREKLKDLLDQVRVERERARTRGSAKANFVYWALEEAIMMALDSEVL